MVCGSGVDIHSGFRVLKGLLACKSDSEQQSQYSLEKVKGSQREIHLVSRGLGLVA